MPEDGAERETRPVHVVLAALVSLVGIGLRVRAYAANRSLWLDEAQLALNILHRSPRELLEPLSYNQAAPAGFLLLEKLGVRLFGDGEAALRLVPLLASILALYVLYEVAGDFLRPAERVFVLGLAALAPPLVYYAAEVKQYSTDALVVLIILWAGAEALDRPLTAARALSLAVAGMVGVWLSHAAVFACAGVGLVLVARAWRRAPRNTVAVVALVIAAWVLSFAAHYSLALAAVRRSGYLRDFWSAGFPTVPPRSWADLAWWPRTLLGIFSDPSGLPFPGVAVTAAVLGCVRLAAARRAQLAVLLAPVLCLLGAAVVHMFPFPTSGSAATLPLQGRVILFVVPLLLLLIAAGLGALWASADRVARAAGQVMAVLLLAGLAVDAARGLAGPTSINELRGLVETIATRGQAGDVIVVNEKARPTLDYYVERESRAQPALRDLAIVELKGKGQWAAFQEQLEGIVAPRVWLVYAHHPDWRSHPDEDQVRAQLERKGVALVQRQAPGAALYLFRMDGGRP